MLLGRLGGDEFAVIVPNATPAAAMELAETLCESVSVATASTRSGVTISVGVAIVGGNRTSRPRSPTPTWPSTRRNGWAATERGCSHPQYQEAARRVSVLQRVAAALDEGTMGLDAQPIVDLASGRIGRHELLIRLRDGGEPPLGPAEFLPAAERTDLVLRLDRWVVERAVAALACHGPARRASASR